MDIGSTSIRPTPGGEARPTHSPAFAEGQRRVLESIATGARLQDSLELLLGVVERESHGLLGSILVLDGTSLRHGAGPSLPAAYNAAIDGVQIGVGVGSCGEAAATARPVIVEDVLVHPNWERFRPLVLEHGLRACWSTPILAPSGRVLGTFAMYYRDPRGPTPADRVLIESVTHLAGLAIHHDALVRREAERRAEEAHLERLRSIVEQAPLPIALLSAPDLVFEIVNDPYSRMTGRGDLRGRRIRDVFPEIESQGAIDLLNRIVATGEPYADPEYRVSLARPEDGKLEERIYDLRLQPYLDPHGAVAGVLLSGVEVTERVRARTQMAALLAQSQEQARMLETIQGVSRGFASFLTHEELVQNVTDAVTRLTRAAFGAFFYNAVSEQGESFTLYTISGVPREAFSRFPMPRNTAVFAPTFTGEAIVRSGDITKDPRYGHSAPHRGMPEGHLPVRSYLAVPVVSRSGKVHGGLFLGHPDADVFTEQAERLAADIAAQAAVGLDNADLYAAAVLSERRFRVLADSMPQLVWFTQPDGRVEWANERWTAFTGQAPEEYADAGWLQAVHGEDRAGVAEGWARALLDGSPFDMRFRVRRSDGEARWHLGRAVPLRDGGGAARWFGTFTDVHDERTAQEQIDRLRLELAQAEKLSALGQLVSGVAHEIRTPLTYLATNLHLVGMGVERIAARAAPEHEAIARKLKEEYVPSALEAIDRINHLVDDLRAYTRLRSGSREVLNVDRVTREAVELFKATHRGRVRVAFEADAPVSVRIDKLQVQQALLNLLQNAVESPPRDHSVIVRSRATATGARITVSDTGPGIPPEVQARMFDPFFTTKSGGTGLGLSIVKRITDDHGIALTVESSGKGTTFVLDVPAAPSA